MSNTIDDIMSTVEKWLVKGEFDSNILHNQFNFKSPFWKCCDKQQFISTFIDSKDYKNTSLAKIVKFEPILKTISQDKQDFVMIVTYHTKNGSIVSEAVVGTLKDDLLMTMQSIYDLAETKQALEIN